MTAPGRSEYFRREAGDYLRELEPLLGSGSPPIEALTRLARGLRGAAMLAGHASFAQAAGELERVIKRLAEGTITWVEVGPALRKAVGHFRQLVGSPARWDRSNDREASRVAEDLQAASGQESPSGSPSPRRSERSETAAYVARQSRTVAVEVDRAARAIATRNPSASEIQGNAQRSMQTLRGLAGLEEFSPLAEIIEATDTLLGELQRWPHPGTRDGEILSLAATALDRVSRSVTDGTPPVPDDPQVTSFTDAMFDRLSRDVVAIENLLDDAAPDAVIPYAGREGPAHASPLELAALGDSLLRAGREIQMARSSTARRLVALTHALTLRTVRGGLGRRPAGPMVAAAVACLEGRTGTPVDTAGPLLEQAGSLITSLPDEHGGARRDGLAAESALDALTVRLAGPRPRAIDHTLLRQEIVSIESLLASAPVPIESLLASEPVLIESLLAPEPISIESLLASEPVPIADLVLDETDRTQLERSLSTYARLLRTAAQVQTLPEVIPGTSRSVDQETNIVAIGRLLFRGRRALERADQLRKQLEGALPIAREDRERLEPLFQELLDLVPLALVADD